MKIISKSKEEGSDDFVANFSYLGFKGQLTSKCLFGILNSLKKMNEKIRLYYYGCTSSRIVFVCFLGEFKTPKGYFEIN